MSYATAAAAFGREPVTVVEIDIPRCTRTYGTSPCTASIPTTGTQKCFNFREHCQDPANFASTDEVLRFCTHTIPWPALSDVDESTAAELRESYFAYPTIDDIDTHPTRIDPEGSLGRRAAVTITLVDRPDSDEGIDPYVAERSYDPLTRSTFWAKLVKRLPYLEGRALRVRRGFYADPWNWDDFQTEHYIIERIEIGDDGQVQVIAKDPLKLADDDRTQAPAVSGGKLAANLPTGGGSASLGSGEGSSYDASGWVRIGSEVIAYTRSGDTLSFSAGDRGALGTTEAEHAEGTDVQQVLAFDGVQPAEIIEDLLTDYAGIDSSLIPTSTWEAEQDLHFPGLVFTAYITEPMGVNSLLAEIMRLGRLLVWWSPEDQEVKLVGKSPPIGDEVTTSLDEDDDLVENRIRTKQLPSKRLTRVYIRYDQIDPTLGLDELANYRVRQGVVNGDAESGDRYGTDPRIETIHTRWLQGAGQGIALQTASRMILAYGASPVSVTFALDASQATVQVGDLVELLCDQFVDQFGDQFGTTVRILSRRYEQDGDLLVYEAEVEGYDGRYAAIAPAGLGDYSAESEANRKAYMFIANSTPVMPDNSDPYLIP